MPGGDGTGPLGLGPMTGRAAGFCAGYPVPGYLNPVPGRGRGWFWGGRGLRRGFRGGFGRGFGRGFFPYFPAYPPVSPEEEMEFLKKQAEYFESSLKEIKEQIAKIENSSKDKES